MMIAAIVQPSVGCLRLSVQANDAKLRSLSK